MGEREIELTQLVTEANLTQFTQITCLLKSTVETLCQRMRVAARCLTCLLDRPQDGHKVHRSSDLHMRRAFAALRHSATFRNLGEKDLKPMSPCLDEWLGELVDVTPYNFLTCYNAKKTLQLYYNDIILDRCRCRAFCFHADLEFCSILSHFCRARREWKRSLCSQMATIPAMHLLKWGSMGAFGKGCFLRLLSVSCKAVL